MKGEVETLPWSESPITSEANALTDDLVNLNSRGLLTINSQPPVDGVKSSHPVYGWGPRNGYVYQKAYLEVFVSPELISELIARMERDPDVTYFAVNATGDLKTNAPSDGGPNAVTWGVFPGKEIVQPTIVETISFLAWKDEFYKIGRDWSACYDAASPSRHLIDGMMQNWYLVNIVHNDFRLQRGIFNLFADLTVPNLDKQISAPTEKVEANGTSNHADSEDNATTGPKVNGVKADALDVAALPNGTHDTGAGPSVQFVN